MANLKIDKNKLVTVRDYFKEGPYGYYTSGNFEQLHSNILVNNTLKKKTPSIESFIEYIIEDIWDIFRLADRIAWEHDLWQKGTIDEGKWFSYGKLDIQLFHIKIRSVFDYIAKIIKRISKKPEQVPDKGFTNLFNWIKESEDNQKKVGIDVSDILVLCDWFYFIKDVRDSDVHRGAFTLVFFNKEHITFQVQENISRKVAVPEIMYNPNVVYFKYYSTLLIAYLLHFLETLSKAIINQINISSYETSPQRVYGSKPVLLDWLEELISIL